MGVGMGLASPHSRSLALRSDSQTPARECGSRTLTAATGSKAPSEGPVAWAPELAERALRAVQVRVLPPLLNLRPYRRRGYLNLPEPHRGPSLPCAVTMLDETWSAI